MIDTHKPYFGQQCQDHEINDDFRELHHHIIQEIIDFCIKHNITIDEVHLSADCLEESIKNKSWCAYTDSSLSFDKFTQEYKDIINLEKIVDEDEFLKVKLEQEPFLYSW